MRAVFFFRCVRGGGNSFTHWRVRGGVWLEQRGAFFFFSPCAAVDIHSLTGASGGAFFFLLRARRGKFTHSLARPRLCVVGTEGAFFFLLRARRRKFTPSLARLRLCVVEKAGAFFFFAPCAAGGNSLTHWRIRGRVFFFLFCARRGKFTHSLARPRLCVVFFVVCAAGEIHSLTRASGGAFFFFLLCARRWTFTHSLARPGVIHSLTGASGGAFFFFAPCAAGEIHSLTGASAAVCGWNRGRVFFLLRARRGKFTPSLARLRLCVVEKAGAFFFFAPCAARGNSLTHWRIRGRVFFFCAAGEIHSLTGASTAVCGFFLLFARRGKFTHSLARPGALFFCLLCARRWTFTHSLARPGVIHSLTGASGGAFFFWLRARWGKFTHSLVRPRLCVVGTEGAFFFFVAPCAAGQAKKKNGARFFFVVRHAAGRAKKKLFSRARRAKKKTHLPLNPEP